MSDSYTKLFASITKSTIWSEPMATRIVWITMLAGCNRSGEYYASVPGLARDANVSLSECEAALATLLAPDPYSRTPDNEGRRIEPIDRGWQILNHAKFDRMRSEIEADERLREQKRRWDREHRPSGYAREQSEKVRKSPNQSELSPAKSDTPPTADVTAKDQKHVPQAARFQDFWDAYPIKRAKKAAQAKWKQKRLDAKADELIADVKRRVRDDQQWRDGFAPHASTYLHQERWTDELAGRKQQPAPSTPSPSCHAPAVIARPNPDEREAKRKVGEEQIKKIEAMLPAMRVTA